MSDDNVWTGYDEDEAPEWLKNIRKSYKELKKENGELRTQVDGFKAQTRTTTVQDLLKRKGYAPEAAGLVPADVSDEASLDKWLGTYGSFLAKQQGEPASTEAPAPQEGQDPNGGSSVPADEQREQERINAAGAAGTPLDGSSSDMVARLRAATTFEELEALRLGS